MIPPRWTSAIDYSMAGSALSIVVTDVADLPYAAAYHAKVYFNSAQEWEIEESYSTYIHRDR